MKMINKNNYIEFIVDYFDGKLSQEEMNALMKFLDHNADCKEEFNNYSDAIINTLVDKNTAPVVLKSILKNIPQALEDAKNEKLVAYIENDLSEKLRLEIEKELHENADMQYSLALLYKTRLQPDRDMVFTKKAVLKHYIISPVIKKVAFSIATAAAILLLYWSISGVDKSHTTSFSAISQMSFLPSFNLLPTIIPNININETPDTAKKSNNVIIETPGHQSKEVIQGIPLIAGLSQIPLANDDDYFYVNDIRTTYLEIYTYEQYRNDKNCKNSNPNPSESIGSMIGWTDWALGAIKGDKSLKENPAHGISISDIGNYGIQTFSRISGANIPLALK